MKPKKIAVIGGGASGMMAAITASRAGASVFLYEQNDRVGKKILSTGNGKCNFSNRDLSLHYYYSETPRQAAQILQRFDTNAAVSFFEKAGMLAKEKNGGLYPLSEQASTVLDILRMQLAMLGVRVFSAQRVTKIRMDKNGKFIVTAENKKAEYDSIILACGGKAAPKTGSDGNGYLLAKSMGHSLIPTVPALVQLICREEYIKSVAGVRLDAKIKLFVDGQEAAGERGELQLTSYGISGIVVFQLSRIASYAVFHKKKVTAYIDCLPDFSMESLQKISGQRIAAMPKCTVEEFFTGVLNKKLMLLFIKLAGLKPGENCTNVPREKIDRVFALCKQFPLTVSGSQSFDNAQVTAGGIPLTEVSKNLESLLVKGLYFAGEMLDVDGKCGGYNLHWAWASGYVAGESAARTNKTEEDAL